MADAEAKFKAAVSVIHSLPKNGSYKPSPQMMLLFYSYYKQATEGQCNRSKPWSWDVVNKAKWDAWNKLGDMSKEEAMEKYVKELMKIIEALPASDQAADFVQTLGQFYEVVDAGSDEATQLKNYSKSKGYDIPQTANGSAPHENDNHTNLHSQANGGTEEMNDVTTSHVIDRHSDHENEDTDTAGKNALNQSLDSDAISEEAELQAHDSDDEFCDTSPVVIHSYERRLDDSGSQSAPSSLSTTSLNDSPSQHGKILLKKSPLDGTGDHTDAPWLRGGQQGTHGIDPPPNITHGEAAPTAAAGRSPTYAVQQQTGIPLSAGSGGGGEEKNPAESNRQSEVQERIAVALLQLQRDMHSVLNRLTTLETITIARQQDVQHCRHCCTHGSEKRASSWWLFDDLSPRTASFVLLWPFVACALTSLWQRSRRRR